MRLLTLDAGTLDAGGWRATHDRRWIADDGSARARVALCEPVTRRYTADGRLAGSVAAGPAPVVDVLELDPVESAALEEEDENPSPPMLVLGSFQPLGGIDTVGRFVVGGAVLDTNDFDGHRCPSEQTALGLWRIARLRGGALWNGIADWVLGWVERRITEASGLGPAHGVWGQGETHVRFLADAALLLLGAGRSAAAERAVELLGEYAVPFAGGRWYVHDSLELATGRPELVMNTHAQVMGVLAAAGRPTGAAEKALDAALTLRASGSASASALIGAVALAASDVAASRGPRPLLGRSQALARRAQQGLARARASAPFLRLPGGYLARDASPRPAPHYYSAVNLYDLGVLAANGVVRDDGPADRAFRAGLRWSRSVGSFAALRRSGIGTAALEPIVWQQAGRDAAAVRAQRRLLDAGFEPAPGWPGHADSPWSAFSAGTI